MKNKDIGILILRLTIGILMLFHGIHKMNHGVSGVYDKLESVSIPGFIAYGVYIGEVVAPILIIIGYRTRLASLIYAFNCLVAIFLVHSADIFALSPHGGWKIELLGLYLFGAIALYFTGAGKHSLSRRNKWD